MWLATICVLVLVVGACIKCFKHIDCAVFLIILGAFLDFGLGALIPPKIIPGMIFNDQVVYNPTVITGTMPIQYIGRFLYIWGTVGFVIALARRSNKRNKSE